MQKKAIVLCAEGFEEVETITPITYLRRAGINVTTASITENLTVKGARGVYMIADTSLLKSESEEWDAVIIPGGLPGAVNLAACERTGAFLKKTAAAGKLICAICASPAVVLAPLGLLAGKRFTCYPGMEETVKDAVWTDDRVVSDGSIITSRAAGTSGEFAIAIIRELLGEETAKKTADSVLLHYNSL
jgi:4-methyl-5(b-hydroxyethyl)-thiazole monophosphate biosynthesis